MEIKIGYYDCVTEKFFGEVDDDMRHYTFAFFKETLKNGDGCSIIKVERHNPEGVYLEGYKRCRTLITHNPEARG